MRRQYCSSKGNCPNYIYLVTNDEIYEDENLYEKGKFIKEELLRLKPFRLMNV
jgi:hypothetical protein